MDLTFNLDPPRQRAIEQARSCENNQKLLRKVLLSCGDSCSMKIVRYQEDKEYFCFHVPSKLLRTILRCQKNWSIFDKTSIVRRINPGEVPLEGLPFLFCRLVSWKFIMFNDIFEFYNQRSSLWFQILCAGNLDPTPIKFQIWNTILSASKSKAFCIIIWRCHRWKWKLNVFLWFLDGLLFLMNFLQKIQVKFSNFGKMHFSGSNWSLW